MEDTISRYRERERVFQVAIDYMMGRIGEKITLVELCKYVGVNRNKMISLFRRFTNSTPFEWLRKKRLDTAKALIEESDAPISIIAMEVGYSDANNFSTAFRNEFGISPRRYREYFNRTIELS
ncbi:helix-turn-helix domain-containing protein [Vibrio penaeicida]|uniref:helix-turn-helix domain-containing protein n=1 Tax=Vibrio penaeicida TaxID=104609 RepID=UPI0027374B4E|nr:helix-turn-helix domain-containing protein [Vibrio penaeicida]MDP2572755.1 helix-turn-helix domain-containing protein [Vibrio penaeicida]